jgi:hypothetical protein
MSVLTCSRRDEVRALLTLGHWPAACAVELREHVDGCAECRAVVSFTLAMQDGRKRAAPALPSAELVWWRAQLRKRQAAMEQMQRPLRRAQMFAVLLSFCVAVGLVVWVTMSDGWSSLVARLPVGVWALSLAGAAVLLLSGVVAYLRLDAE